MASAYLFGMLAITPSESREVALIANPEFEAGRVAGHRARRLIDGGNPARELAVVTVGMEAGATYEAEHHRNAALAAGVRREQLDHLQEFETADCFTDQE